MSARYARQQAVPGWNQQALTRRTLIVAGSGPLAFFCGLMATSLGVGRIALVGNGRVPSGRVCLPGEKEGEKRVVCWAQLFAAINPQVKIYPLSRTLDAGLLSRARPSGLILADRDLLQADLHPDKTPLTRAALAADRGAVWGARLDRSLVSRLGRAPESPLIAQIAAALVVEEFRKIWMPLPGETPPGTADSFALPAPKAAPPPSGHTRVFSTEPHFNLVGAGALGTWFTLALGLQGRPAHLRIFDPDSIEETNLNRQVLFYDAVGHPKAEVLARRLSAFFPHLRAAAHVLPVRENTLQRLRHSDALIACPDNFTTRALLNRVAVSRKQILINGGTSPFGGDAACYLPGRTACLDCSQHVEAMARVDQTAHCHATEASTVTSNAIIGGIMAWMARISLGDRIVDSVVEYDGSLSRKRIGPRSSRPACQCHAGAPGA